MPRRSFPLQPVPIHVSDEVLDDLRARLRLTRWPDDAGNEDGYYGVRRDYLRGLVDYWATEFDWRAAEAAINAYPHHHVEVDSVPVHFLRRPGVGPAPTPLILTHGWPWTFWHWAKVIDALADPGAHGGDPDEAFDVIVPSLPGFGFSTPLTAAPGHELLENRRGVAHADDRDSGLPEVCRRGLRRRRAGHRATRAQIPRRALRHPHRLGPEALDVQRRAGLGYVGRQPDSRRTRPPRCGRAL